MPQGDQTGPKGEGPETGRGLGKVVDNSSGQSTDEGRPYDGRGRGYGNRPIRDNYGPGSDNTRTYESKSSSGIESKVSGPGGHVPDGTGPHGRGMGPGEGKGDGSGLENITNVERQFIGGSKAYGAVAKEYGSIYSQYNNGSNSTGLKEVIMQAHNEAVKKGYKGNERREYVKNETSKYSKSKAKSNSKSSKSTTKTSTKSSSKKVA